MTNSPIPISPRADLAAHPLALWPKAAVLSITGLSNSVMYRAIAADTFPAPIKIGRSSRWRAGEVLAWLERQGAELTA